MSYYISAIGGDAAFNKKGAAQMINRRGGASDYLNPYSNMRLSRSGRKNIKDQFGQYTRTHSASEFEKLITQKYFLLCDELHKRCTRAFTIIFWLKVITFAVFIAFSVVAIICGTKFGSKMLWLSFWIVLIFVDVGFFLVADYCKSLIVEKVLPYLDNVEQIDFGISEDDEEEARNEEDAEDEDDEDDT